MSAGSASRRGRPVLFLGTVCLAWVALRMTSLALWPEEPVPGIEREVPAEVLAEASAVSRSTPDDTPPASALDNPSRSAGPTPATVEGLDPAPPAHLQSDFGTAPAVAAHSALWIAAAAGPEAGGEGAGTGDPAQPVAASE